MKRKRVIAVTTGRTPKSLSKSIDSCLALGPGHLENFHVNGKLKFKRITWKNTCTIKIGNGLICDGRKRCDIPFGTYWGAASMTATMVFNNVDPDRFRSYQQKAAKKKAKKIKAKI